MSVYKRSYRPYEGRLSSPLSRFFVLVRYAMADAWGSRITNVLFVLCLVPTLLSMVTIYIMNNDAVRLLIGGPHPPPALTIDQRFFYYVLQSQCWCALVLTAWVGPRLISSEMANNALPIILSHPISRTEYVLAKLLVLVSLLSAVTWVPSLFLFFFQAHMSALPWAAGHSQIAAGIFAGAALWIMVLSLLALAVASWVKWRIVATGMVFGFLMVPAGTGVVFNQVMRTDWGNLVNIPFLMTTLWRRLLQVPMPDYVTRHQLPTLAALVALAVFSLTCAAALNARIRAREVVRG